MESKEERNRRYQREYRERHPDKVRERRQQFRLNEPERDIWYKARSRAKRLSVEFNIEVCDIRIPELCPILDIPICKGVGKVHDGSPSLDRIDPDKGYVKDNVCVISHKANRYKDDMTIDILRRILEYMTGKQRKD